MWGTPGCLNPTKIQGQSFSEVKVGGTFTLLTDKEGHIMQTSNGALPQYVQGLEDNFALSLTVGGNFAFVIGKTSESLEDPVTPPEPTITSECNQFLLSEPPLETQQFSFEQQKGQTQPLTRHDDTNKL